MLAAFFALYGLYEGPFRPFSEARGMNIESLICILDLAIILDNLQPIVHMYTYYSYSLGAQR